VVQLLSKPEPGRDHIVEGSLLISSAARSIRRDRRGVNCLNGLLVDTDFPGVAARRGLLQLKLTVTCAVTEIRPGIALSLAENLRYMTGVAFERRCWTIAANYVL